MTTITLRDVIAANRTALAEGTLAALVRERGEFVGDVEARNVYPEMPGVACAIGCALPDSYRHELLSDPDLGVCALPTLIASGCDFFARADYDALELIQRVHDAWLNEGCAYIPSEIRDGLRWGGFRRSEAASLRLIERPVTRADFEALLEEIEADLDAKS